MLVAFVNQLGRQQQWRAEQSEQGGQAMSKTVHLVVIIAVSLVLGAALGFRFQDQPHRLSDHDIKELFGRMERDAERFRKSLHEDLEHAHWEDKRDREGMNKAAADFERATDRLKDHFHNGNARPGDVQEVLDRGAAIDAFIVGRHLVPRARADWMTLRGDLDQLASAYNITWSWPEGPQG